MWLNWDFRLPVEVVLRPLRLSGCAFHSVVSLGFIEIDLKFIWLDLVEGTNPTPIFIYYLVKVAADLVKYMVPQPKSDDLLCSKNI